MKFDDLFEQRSLVASKLKECIRDKGFTKVSFSKKAEISRPTLDKLMSGAVDSKTTFDRHMQKILKALNMSADDLMLYTTNQTRTVMAVYSQNAPSNHEMNDVAKKQFDLMLDIVELCTIYY
jgi:predicted transcriptional regulator